MSKREIFKKAWKIRKTTASEIGCKVSEVNMGECLKMAYKSTNTSVKLQGSEKQIAWATSIRKSLCDAIESIANSNNVMNEVYFTDDNSDMAESFISEFERMLVTGAWGKDLTNVIEDKLGISVYSVSRKAIRAYYKNKNNREYFDNMSSLLNNYLSEEKASVWIDRRYDIEDICKNINTRTSK